MRVELRYDNETYIDGILHIRKLNQMKYITPVVSNTGKKFVEVHKRFAECDRAAKKLAKELCVKEWHPSRWRICGGMLAVKFNDNHQPDMKVWKKFPDSYGFFQPRLTSKEGKVIEKRMDDLPTVTNLEVNTCVGFAGDPFKNIGFNLNSKKFVGIDVEEKWGIKMPKDCKEITVTEWNKIFNDKRRTYIKKH